MKGVTPAPISEIDFYSEKAKDNLRQSSSCPRRAAPQPLGEEDQQGFLGSLLQVPGRLPITLMIYNNIIIIIIVSHEDLGHNYSPLVPSHAQHSPRPSSAPHPLGEEDQEGFLCSLLQVPGRLPITLMIYNNIIIIIIVSHEDLGHIVPWFPHMLNIV